MSTCPCHPEIAHIGFSISLYSLKGPEALVDGDGELVRQTLAGRTAAYEQLVRRWSTRVLALCHARVRDAAAAEDLAQETLLRGFRGLKTLAEPDRFGSWLFGIAARTCLDWLKSSQRTEVG